MPVGFFKYGGRVFSTPAGVLRAMLGSGRIPTLAEVDLAARCAALEGSQAALDDAAIVRRRWELLGKAAA